MADAQDGLRFPKRFTVQTVTALTLVKSLMRSAALTPFWTLKLISTFTSVKESVNLIIGT